jgi:hypothetical protein
MIDRVRYYDGEFLRAFDFNDEQTYHMEMRRRLNRYLHVHGIVRGLELQFSSDTGIGQVSILPGLAIDAFGREIYVFAPYTLGNDDVVASRLTKNTYDVWLRYNRIPGTPPSAGYGVCNLANQYTRWTESFKVVLLQSPSNPFKAPQFADEDMDDPSQDGVGVLLGSVSVDPTSATSQFASPAFHHRHFWGSIVSRIEAPPGHDATSTFDLTKKQTPRNPPVSLDIEPNVFAKQNLIVGPDFDLETVVGKTKVPQIKGPGVAKIASDLLVQGNIYSNIPDSSNVPQWLALTDYVKQLVQQTSPNVKIGSSGNMTVSKTATSGNYVTGIAPITVTSDLPKVSSFVAYAYPSQWQFDTETNISSLAGKQVQLGITSLNQNDPSGNNCTLNVAWIAGPANGVFSAIANFTLTAVFICFP